MSPPHSRTRRETHDENIKKIARRIQIHNAKRCVPLDKTFSQKENENVNVIYYLQHSCVYFLQPRSTFSLQTASYDYFLLLLLSRSHT